MGWTLVVYACGSMAAAAITLRLGGGRTFARAAAIQAVLPVLALIALLASVVQAA